MTEDKVILNTWQRNILRMVCAPKTKHGICRNKINLKPKELYKTFNLVYTEYSKEKAEVVGACNWNEVSKDGQEHF
jgi:hypothetical protein